MIRLQFQSSPVVQCHNLPLSCPGLDFEDCSSLLWHSLVWDTQVSVPGSHMFRFDSDGSVLSLTLTGSHSIDFCHSCWQCKNWDESLKSLLDASHGAMAMAIIYMAQNLFSAHPTVWPDRVTCCSDVADIGSGCWHIFCPTSRLHWSQHWLLGHSPAATRLCSCGCIQYALLEPDLGTGCA